VPADWLRVSWRVAHRQRLLATQGTSDAAEPEQAECRRLTQQQQHRHRDSLALRQVGAWCRRA
jgi:hypothetical protein